jgi:tetratricopeptide (TPR) repeat protein
MRSALAIFVLSAGMFAQSAPPSCPADRPVDDLIAEIHKQQSPKKHRNKNPLPESVCVFGWCTGGPRRRPATQKPAPPSETASTEDTNSSGTSSSRSTSSSVVTAKCDEAMEFVLSAAHNVDVGDFNFGDKNYRGALMRYRDALEEKPGDAAIHVRLGRTYEKMKEIPPAIEHYQAAQELQGPPKWLEEAKSALTRLQPPPSS